MKKSVFRDIFRDRQFKGVFALNLYRSVRNMFSNSTVGLWYDPTNISSMFQDSSGITPVTAPGQSVGLRLDMSKGMYLGAEAVGAGVIGLVGAATAATYSTTTGVGTVTRVDATNQSFVQFSGLSSGYYKVTITCTSGSFVAVRTGAYSGSGIIVSPGSAVTLYAPTSGGQLTITSGGGTSGFTLASMRLIEGNHATQASAGARLTYGIEPKTGTRNLLVQTEAFDTASWVKQLSSITSTSGVAPDGSSTADTVTEGSGSGWHAVYNSGVPAIVSGQNHALSVYIKAGTRRYVQFSSGAIGGTNQTNFGVVVDTSVSPMTIVATGNGTSGTYVSSSIQNVGSGWHRVYITGSIVSTSGFLVASGVDSASYSINPQSSGSQTFLIWGAQLELSSAVTPYQKVVTAFEVTEAGVPTCHYCAYAGANSMATATIDFTATDKMSVFAGLRKLSDVAEGAVAELSTGAGNGRFLLTAPPGAGSAQYGFTSVGTSSGAAASGTFTAPVSNVVTGLGDISGDRATLRVNGAQVAQSTSDQGTGNYGNYPVYLGRRGGSTVPFVGRDYGVIIVGKSASSVEISNAEALLANNTPNVTL